MGATGAAETDAGGRANGNVGKSLPVAVAAAVLPSAPVAVAVAVAVTVAVAGTAAVVVATACAPDDDPGPCGVAAGSDDTSGGAAVAATFAEENAALAALAGLVELGLSYVKSASMPSTEAVTTPPAIHCRRRRSWRGDESVDDSDVATRSDGVLGAGR